MKRWKWAALALLIVPLAFTVALSNRNSEKNHAIDDLGFALTQDDADVRLAAIVALTAYGADAIPYLAKALGDTDPNIRKAAIGALGKISDEKAADALVPVLSDPDRDMRSRAIMALTKIGEPAVPHMFKVLESEPFPRGRMFAASGLAHHARQGDVPEIMKRFEPQDAATQMYLVIALVRIGNNKAYDALRELFQSPKRLVRLYVVSTIAESPNGKRALPLLTEAMNDEISEIRYFAMTGMKKLNLPETYPLAVQALTDPYEHVRKEAADTLGNLGNPEAAPALIPCLKDPYFLVRAHSAEALGKIGDPGLLPDIAALIADPDLYVQIKAAGALARLHDYSEVDRLVLYLSSPELLYRTQAHEALCDFSNEDFGNDTDAWARWWKQTQETMTTPQPAAGS